MTGQSKTTIKSYLETKLKIQSDCKYKPRAGIVLVRQEKRQPMVLLIKEKGGGKRWGFPKGGVEYRCRFCQTLIRQDQQSQQPFCPGQNGCVHDLDEETILECGQRELLEETNWSLQPEDQVLFLRRTSNCYYMAIQTDQVQTIKICPREISTFRWIFLVDLIDWACRRPMSFNYGARLMIQQLYNYWYHLEREIYLDVKYQRFPQHEKLTLIKCPSDHIRTEIFV